MDDYKYTLRKVGWTLVIIGVIDIGIFIYCVMNEISYSSSFNILAVIAGVFLIRTNIKASRTIAWFASFFIAGFIGVYLIMPIIEPFDLILLRIKLDPFTMLLLFTAGPAFILYLIWVYNQLTSTQVLQAQKESGLSSNKTKSGFFLGGGLVLVLATALVFMMNSNVAKIAKDKAKEKMGSEYKYHIFHLRIFRYIQFY